MKTEYRIKKRWILLVSMLTAISAAYFLFDYSSKTADDSNNIKIDSVNKNNSVPDNKDEKSDIKKIDWTPIVEKWKGKEISKVGTDQKLIALTFDGGANADGVEKILDILKKENIKATFFLTGEFIKKYPDKIKLLIENGGNIGNHSFSHPHFTKISGEKIADEISSTESEFAKLGMKFDPLFRFPFGERDARAIEAIKNKGYISIRWTVDSLGWKGTSGKMTKDSVKDRVVSKAAPGAIILMHLGSNPDDKTQLDSEALPEIINALEEQGYKFVTMADLLKSLDN